jgi:hypothetical protein
MSRRLVYICDLLRSDFGAVGQCAVLFARQWAAEGYAVDADDIYSRDYLAIALWPAPGSEDTELGVLMELEVGHGETEVHAGVQA